MISIFFMDLMAYLRDGFERSQPTFTRPNAPIQTAYQRVCSRLTFAEIRAETNIGWVHSVKRPLGNSCLHHYFILENIRSNIFHF